MNRRQVKVTEYGMCNADRVLRVSNRVNGSAELDVTGMEFKTEVEAGGETRQDRHYKFYTAGRSSSGRDSWDCTRGWKRDRGQGRCAGRACSGQSCSDRPE